MAVKSFYVTLSGVSQRLVDAVVPAIVQAESGDLPYAELHFQAGQGNTGAVYIGDDSKPVSATDYGIRLFAGTVGETAQNVSPHVLATGSGGASLRLSDFRVLGTADEVLVVLGVQR